MLSSTPPHTSTVLRNYAIAATAVLVLSIGASDLFNNSHRISAQNIIDGYSYYASVGLVNYTSLPSSRDTMTSCASPRFLVGLFSYFGINLAKLTPD